MNSLDYKRVRGGVLVQERASTTIEESEWTVVTKRAPTPDEYRNLRFAWRAVGIGQVERDRPGARLHDHRHRRRADVAR
jgi:AICAR transformylase/IMP cyclohydrolase PurH